MITLTPVFHYEGLKDFSNPNSVKVHIALNENPLYFDEEGNRNYEEPSYQSIIRVEEVNSKQPPLLIYDYFESPTLEEAQYFIQQLVQEIHQLGFSYVQA